MSNNSDLMSYSRRKEAKKVKEKKRNKSNKAKE